MRILVLACLLGGTAACLDGAPYQGPNYPGPVKRMQEVDTVNTTPDADQAVIVFVRPTGANPGSQWSVFELVEKDPATLVGILGAMKKVAHRTSPGRHLFMALGTGGGTDFMNANVEAGKLYYVLLVPGEAGFSMQPIHASEHGQLGDRLKETAWVATTPDSLAWARENADDIEARRFKYYGIWRRKPSFERLALFPDDGR